MLPMLPAKDRAVEWRERAKELRRFGADEQALTLEWCADDLEESLRIWETEPLTLEEAEAYSGYAYSTLQQKVASGEIPNVGEPGRPRVRRADLPRRAPSRSLNLETGEPDLAGEVFAERY